MNPKLMHLKDQDMMFFLSNMLKPTINLKAFGEDKITENKFIF
jgi:hypothetical protein